MADAALALGRAEPVQGTGCVVYGASMRRQDLERVEIESALRTAVERSELRVFYQPIVSIQNGEIEALEALVRWEHPERGLIAPGEFIPVAEQTGLIVGIGSWVLREACREAFISKLRDDREDEAIVSAIAGMARALDLRVVGEGVEHEGQLRSLRRLGFDSAQGYLFGRPGPARGIAASSPARLRKPLPPVELLGGEPALAAAGS